MRNWPEPKWVRNIQVFLSFANFYWYFIPSCSKIVKLLTLMLQTNGSSKNLPSLMDMAEHNKFGIVDGIDDYENKTVERSTSKNLNKAMSYLTSEARLAFTKLRKMFIEALILQYFDLEYHIWIKTDASGYAISKILSQLTLDNLGQWHPLASYLQKIIPAKFWYKTHDSEFLAIVEAFKI